MSEEIKSTIPEKEENNLEEKYPSFMKEVNFEEEKAKYLKFIQEKKYDMFQTIGGLVDVQFVKGPPCKILMKTVTEIDLENPLIKNSGLEFEVKVMNPTDEPAQKPIVVTSAGIKKMDENQTMIESDDKEAKTDFVTISVDGKSTKPMVVKKDKSLEDIKLTPKDMVFKPGN